MALLKPSVQKQVRDALSGMTGPVRILVFTTDADRQACEMCDDTRQLVEELACLSDGRIAVETADVRDEAGSAATYGIDRAPALVVLGDAGRDYGIRFFGIPSGYEFAALIGAVLAASTGRADLSPATRRALGRLRAPLHIRVFVTPTCPYCPPAVMLAHSLAVAHEGIRAEMIDATEFPELADRYGVHAVPRTVINEAIHVEGAVPEGVLIEKLAPWLQRPPDARP